MTLNGHIRVSGQYYVWLLIHTLLLPDDYYGLGKRTVNNLSGSQLTDPFRARTGDNRLSQDWPD